MAFCIAFVKRRASRFLVGAYAVGALASLGGNANAHHRAFVAAAFVCHPLLDRSTQKKLGNVLESTGTSTMRRSFQVRVFVSSLLQFMHGRAEHVQERVGTGWGGREEAESRRDMQRQRIVDRWLCAGRRLVGLGGAEI